MIQILKACEIDIAVDALKSEDIVAIPTETVYGLAGNAFNELTVAKIFAAKNRPSFDPLIVHVQNQWMNLSELARRRIVDSSALTCEASATCDRLFKEFCPGPLTFILPKGKSIPDLVTSGKMFVGIRSPRHPLAQQILRCCDLALAAPSANRFGKVSPTSAAHVVSELENKISYVVDGGISDVGLESTVVAINDDGSISILRPGYYSETDFKKINVNVSTRGNAKKITAPGQLDSHYAPDKKMKYIENANGISEFLEGIKSQSTHLLLPHPETRYTSDLQNLAKMSVKKIILDSDNFDQMAARNLFSCLRQFNTDPTCEKILCFPVLDENGLWPAIKDRLSRASHT